MTGKAGKQKTGDKSIFFNAADCVATKPGGPDYARPVAAQKQHCQRLSRGLSVCGFILAPFMAVGLLAGVVSMAQFVPRYPFGRILAAAAAAAAVYIMFKLLTALFVSL